MMNIPLKKNYGILLLLALFMGLSPRMLAQNQASIIKTQAMDMARAMLKKDNSGFVKYMHPQLIEAAGGKAKMMEMMDTLQNSMNKFGAVIQKILIGNPTEIIKYQKTLQCTLPQTTFMSFMSGNIEATTTLIALSENNGVHWYFIDTNMYRGEKLKKSLPLISPQLVIPPMSAPKMTPKE